MAIATINPATGQVLKKFEPLTQQQIDNKIEKAAATFAEFRKVPFAERARLMQRAGDILEREKQEFARLMTLEMGKTIGSAVAEAANALRLAATTLKTLSVFWPMNWWRPPLPAAMSAISRWASFWPLCRGTFPSGR